MGSTESSSRLGNHGSVVKSFGSDLKILLITSKTVSAVRSLTQRHFVVVSKKSYSQQWFESPRHKPFFEVKSPNMQRCDLWV